MKKMSMYSPVCMTVCIPPESPLRSSENHNDSDDFRGVN